jgi:acyl-CoA thioesterase-1|tara:strand:+ start:2104 stop:2832 length:729 start_codon:yes stop_codon:yes gene_type:complete
MPPGRGKSLVAAGLACVLAAAGIGLWISQVPRPAAIAPAPFATPPAAPRIVAMGTSLTANYTWPGAMEKLLSACLGVPVDLTVVAKAGQTSDWGAANLQRVIAARPDAVLVEFIANDSDLRHHLSPRRSLVLHTEIIDRIRAALPDTRILLIGTNPVFGLRRLLRPRMGAYLANYAALADRDPAIGLLDMAPYWRQRWGDSDPRRDLPDGLHPQAAAASAVMAGPTGKALAALWNRPCDVSI